MDKIHKILADRTQRAIAILDDDILIKKYAAIDLSESNEHLMEYDIDNHYDCQEYVDMILMRNNSIVAFGGYLEKRNLYSKNSSFNNNGISRNVHLGMDFWAKAGTKVVTPVDGKVHSFQNNSNYGDYGPTIILEHELNGLNFHSLYGHLSVESLDGLYFGKLFRRGETLATLGSPEVNVGYAAHFHFQIIVDMQGYVGDYPGVCAERALEYYTRNCPDPNLLLKIGL